MLLIRVAADIGERQNDHREARRGGYFRRCGWLGLRLRRLADFEPVDPDRLGDVLELCWAEVSDGEIEPPLDLTIGVLGKADRTRLGGGFKPRGDVDPVAHQVAIALLDNIAQMNADTKVDPLLRR